MSAERVGHARLSPIYFSGQMREMAPIFTHSSVNPLTPRKPCFSHITSILLKSQVKGYNNYVVAQKIAQALEPQLTKKASEAPYQLPPRASEANMAKCNSVSECVLTREANGSLFYYSPRLASPLLILASSPTPLTCSFLKMLGLAHFVPQFLELGYDDLELLEQLVDAVRVLRNTCGVTTV